MTNVIAFRHYTKPTPLPAGCIGVLICLEADGRLFRGIITNRKFDGMAPRFIPAGFVPGFGRVTKQDHLKQIHRIGEGSDAFVQYENDEQRDERINGRPAHALAWHESECLRLCRESE